MKYLKSTYYFDYESDEIQKLIQEFKEDALTQKKRNNYI